MKSQQLASTLLIGILFSGCKPEPKKQADQTVMQEGTPALLLGMYHFNNPGQDTYNMEVDDYFSETRQKEIAEVVDLLADFKPTKIFVEFTPAYQPMLDSLLKLYKNDKITLNKIKGGTNEVYQIGFRLAKKSGIAEIIAVDHPGQWLGPYADFIADTLQLEAYQKNKAEQASQIQRQQEQFLKSTVRENLLHMNRKKQVLRNHDYYNNVAIAVKDTAGVLFSYQQTEQDIDGLPYLMRSFDFNNIGVELVAEWYKRNLFIYRNILENTQADDRVLIIFGQGHIRYLHQLLEDNPEFQMMEAQQFLKTN
ncbi:MAG TPA: hypothetical protein DCG19_02165 [Cryomorphaceae bacterium]|nr:hypothetical protein [Owenweeksia sp.]HAD96177.1 hypothetical protein [Cryomorphaceae bacterium]HBF19452.1 hypothetical protein [Cryomorphaceae bacterium]HCQ14829.1 hypothetical protein [Cryomorphaceae bacterium]|tara:strand:+ start:7916 stop:8842 length:927 start_codon:yes stop_codon:yes gene_type:complete